MTSRAPRGRGAKRMLGRIIRDWCQMRAALKRYYLRRARGRSRPPLTPEQEYEQVMRELRYRQELARRLSRWR